ncbi:MAG: TolC family outer membrane protein [Rhizobacter sp.]
MNFGLVGLGRLAAPYGVWAALASAGGHALAQPLPELGRSALASDPAVAGAQAQVRATEERLAQARAAFGPTAAITGSKSESRYTEKPAENMRPFLTKQVALQISQPLLRAASFSSLDQAEAQLDQSQAQLQQSQIDALQRLIEACFEVLKARDALALTHAQQAATSEQLASAQRSFKIGTAPITDVREAEAKADTIAAQLAAAEHEFDLRQQILAETVGQPVQGLTTRGLTGERLPVLPVASIPDWLSTAMAQSPQLKQAEHALLAAVAEVRKAETAHGPTADLTYSWTRSSETGSATSIFPRSAVTSQVGVNVNIPLFASGGTQAKVREAAALRDKAQSDVDAARRSITLGVRQGVSATLSSVSQSRGLEAAVKSGETSLRANRRGYEVGMRVNAEVLDAQTKLFEARRDLSKARYDAWVNLSKLKAVSGRLTDADLAELEGLLVPLEPDAVQRTNRPSREEGR